MIVTSKRSFICMLVVSIFALVSNHLTQPVFAVAATKSAVTTRIIQNELVSKKYLKASFATGAMNSATKKAIRIFQIANNLTISSNVNATTRAKIVGNGKNKPLISKVSWSSSGINSAFPRGGYGKIISIGSDIVINVKRAGGTEHIDAKPRSSTDLAKLKRLYNNKLSWDSKPIILIAGGRFFAAACNGMIHGSKDVFCIHLMGSVCHGSGVENINHQRNINKTYTYWYSD